MPAAVTIDLVKRAWPAAATLVAAVLAAPTAWSGSEGQQAPTASLRVSPSAIQAGEAVTLDASGSTDDGAIASYAWDLDGDGAFERVAGGDPVVSEALTQPGTVRVGVRVVDADGQSADAFETVTVQAKPEPEPQAPAEPEAPAAPSRREAAESDGEAAAPEEPAPPKRRGSARRSEPRIGAAASATVTMADFKFAPASVTVNVGDTVTWRNTGDEAHTATAKNGGFDTGNVNPGSTGSATFRSAGTFSYFCKPHPFMTGTVRVVGTGGGGGGGGGTGAASNGGGSAAGGGGTGAAGSGGTGGTGGTGAAGDLPSTGVALQGFVLTGALLLVTGVALRRRVAASR